MNGDVVIKAENLSKTYYPPGTNRVNGIKDILSFGRASKAQNLTKVFALKDVSFEIKRGEAVGVIGKNGAGKSTLLKLLSGVTQPTSGKVTIKGRVQSVLDIDTGFHPDLTGRENIYLKGKLSGLSAKEIDGNINDIIEFSGVGKYIDMPVKYYSSGMYLRLAFAFIAQVESEIILFDEAFSVGDLAFNEKVAERMKALFKKGKTVVIVSHSFNEIMRFCKKLMVIKKGELVAFGDSMQVMAEYMDGLEIDMDTHIDPNYNLGEAEGGAAKEQQSLIAFPEKSYCRTWDPASAPGNAGVKLLKLEVLNRDKENSGIYTDNEVKISAELLVINANQLFEFALLFRDRFDNDLFVSFSKSIERTEWAVGKINFVCNIPPNFFNKGLIKVGAIIASERPSIIYRDEDLLRLSFKLPNNRLAISKFVKLFPGPLAGEALTWNIKHVANEL